MDKKDVLVYGCVGLIWHLGYLEMHEAMHTITKPGVTSVDGYIWPAKIHDLGSSITTSAVYVVG